MYVFGVSPLLSGLNDSAASGLSQLGRSHIRQIWDKAKRAGCKSWLE
jgi:hypothetical protein